jgi:hypothetical protein
MRSEGWLAVSLSLNNQVARLLRAAKTTRTECWNDPLSIGGRKITDLFSQLLPPIQTSKNLRTLHESKARCAVLCTNLSSVKKFDWQIASRILALALWEGQQALSTVALREHWRGICRKNSSTQTALVPSSAKTPRTQGKWRVWRASTVGPAGLHHEIYSSASDIQHGIIVNLDDNAIILKDVSPSDAATVLKEVEAHYLDGFFSSLAARSPFNPELPWAIAGSFGHTLIHGTWLYAELTGYRDLTREEALSKLRQYPFEELHSSILRLNPGNIADASDILTQNGRNRLQGFSLIELVNRHDSFENLVGALTPLRRLHNQVLAS